MIIRKEVISRAIDAIDEYRVVALPPETMREWDVTTANIFIKSAMKMMWVSVKDSLPDVNKTVFARSVDGNFHAALFTYPNGFLTNNGNGFEATHWMEIPPIE